MWIQSKYSKDAEKFKATIWAPTAYRVHDVQNDEFYFLPRSEYGPCEPPPVWDDVTSECALGAAIPPSIRMSIIHTPHLGLILASPPTC